MKYAKTEFTTRLARHYDELKWLYMELYQDEEAFDYFTKMLRRCWDQRKKPSGTRTSCGRPTPAGTAAGTCWA